MRILFDHGTPRGIARALADHTVITAYAQGWDRLNNGALLRAAEDAAIDVLLTTDQRIRYQQNLANRQIAIVVLTGTARPNIWRFNIFSRLICPSTGPEFQGSVTPALTAA